MGNKGTLLQICRKISGPALPLPCGAPPGVDLVQEAPPGILAHVTKACAVAAGRSVQGQGARGGFVQWQFMARKQESIKQIV